MAELKQHVSVDEDNSKVDYIKSQSLALSNRFKRSLGNNATVHDELLKNLTLDNMKIEKPDEKHDAKKTKKHTKMVKHWVDIMKALRTENEKIDFAALTVFRNSGIPTLDNKHIEQIIECIIKPYLNMENEEIKAPIIKKTVNIDYRKTKSSIIKEINGIPQIGEKNTKVIFIN